MSVIDASGLIDFDSVASSTMRILVDHSVMLNQETVNFAVDGIQDRNSIFDEMSFFQRHLARVDDVIVHHATSVSFFGFGHRHFAAQEIARLGAIVSRFHFWRCQMFCPSYFFKRTLRKSSLTKVIDNCFIFNVIIWPLKVPVLILSGDFNRISFLIIYMKKRRLFLTDVHFKSTILSLFVG